MNRWLSPLTALLLVAAATPAARAQDDILKRLNKVESDYAELKKQLQQKPGSFDFAEFFRKMHFHGYGEVHYQFPDENTAVVRGADEFDVHRLVFGWGYEFTDSVRFDAEIDFEHAADEIELEYAQLEADICDGVSLRAGSLLMPMGPLNEFHEPPNYYSVDRPYVQRSILPTTWQEIGAGLAGQALDGTLAFRAYVVNGLKAEDFTAKDGIRGGRQKGIQAEANDIAGVARIEYAAMQNIKIGVSGYYGGADQDVAGLSRVAVGIVEADLHLRQGPFEFTALYARTGIHNADNVSALTGLTIGDEQYGWYAEGAYHMGECLFGENSEKDLVVFGRRERFDTQHSVASGFTANPIYDRGVWTFGAAYFPVRKVAVKADCEIIRDAAGNDLSRVNLGIGWMF